MPCPVEQLETVLEPVRDYYGRELSSLETVAAMVLEIDIPHGISRLRPGVLMLPYATPLRNLRVCVCKVDNSGSPLRISSQRFTGCPVDGRAGMDPGLDRPTEPDC